LLLESILPQTRH